MESTRFSHYGDHPVRRRIEIELETNYQFDPNGFKIFFYDDYGNFLHVGLSQDELVRGIMSVFAYGIRRSPKWMFAGRAAHQEGNMNANIVSKPLACKAWAILVTCLFNGGITGSASAPVSAQPAQQMDVPAEPVEQAQA